ncbi:unnamed protein product, partial [Mesorhabditis belari]|uniref:G-protein coupled receptors family 1 profile domain-containing protein n=1 Tax=Mesorhabditis belari TaxID=2138241 RepID=A0AAF3FHU2_9BILA
MPFVTYFEKISAWEKCLPDHRYVFFVDPLRKFILQTVFPVQFTLGVLGNSLIFWVLTSGDAANIASDLLAAVSLCDMMFLFMMVPHSLASIDSLAKLYHFRYFYIKTKQHMAAIANWMSAAAIWLILAVSLERFLIVRSPLRAKLYWERGRMATVLGSVFLITGILTIYHHFEYDCQMIAFCNGTQLYDICYPASESHPAQFGSRAQYNPTKAVQMYIRSSTFFNAVLVVLVPMVVVVVLNICLLRALRLSTERNIENSLLTSSFSRTQQKTRRRVTATVAAIGLCFAITQGPSAVMAIWELVAGFDNVGEMFYKISSITNSLVVMGKTLNFVLFCLSSEHFRLKCLRSFTRTFPSLSRSVSRFSRGRRSSEKNSLDRPASVRSNRPSSSKTIEKPPTTLV